MSDRRPIRLNRISLVSHQVSMTLMKSNRQCDDDDDDDDGGEDRVCVAVLFMFF
jgi:hypothetical protein